MEFADLIESPKLDNVKLSRSLHGSVLGTLCITGHHLIFSSRRDSTAEELLILHRCVDVVERKLSQSGGTVTIKCKDFRIIQLEILGYEECNNVANSVQWLSSLSDCTNYYPFFHRELLGSHYENGWTTFLPDLEFAKILAHTDEWRISNINKEYAICSTYSQSLIVPKSIDDATLIVAAGFRCLGRFPVFSYVHKETKAALLRSGQPMVGTNNRRCREDEKLLNVVLCADKKGYIIDTRTESLAQLSRTKGGGVEPEMHYPMWRRIHNPIDRHTSLLDSLSKLIEACNDIGCSVDKWLSRLESSGWLSHVKDVLTCACLVAQCIDKEGTSVLVHGAEGTDSTLQVCALAQVILDPDSRTVHGFEALVEREWLQAGHPFATRYDRGAYAGSSIRTKEQSPTFLMFLDCVYQIHYQFPCSFEFSEEFLVRLFEHAYASQFGTFLGNCDKDRQKLDVENRTVSLWSHLNHPDILPTFLNPVYEPNSNVIWPSVAPQSLILWHGMYLRWVWDPSPQIEEWKTIGEIRKKEAELRSKAVKLRRQIMELQKTAIEMGVLLPPSTEEEAEALGAVGGSA